MGGGAEKVAGGRGGMEAGVVNRGGGGGILAGGVNLSGGSAPIPALGTPNPAPGVPVVKGGKGGNKIGTLVACVCPARPAQAVALGCQEVVGPATVYKGFPTGT